MSSYASKLGLGTAQWGMQYGVSNTQGQTVHEEVDKIIKMAHNAGISILDTAFLYGNAEQTLGRSNLASFRVITKTPQFRKEMISKLDADHLVDTFFSSLQKLGLKSTYGLLLHNVEDIFTPHGVRLVAALELLKRQGLVTKIGISVYGSNQIEKALELFKPDIVQLPLNVLDQRLIHDGTLAHLSGLGIEVHARSIFLQGLLLMNINDMPFYFKPWMPLLAKWQSFCRDHSISPLDAALGYVCELKDVTQALVGVQTQNQLEELLEASSTLDSSYFDQFACDDTQLLNPSFWSIS